MLQSPSGHAPSGQECPGKVPNLEPAAFSSSRSDSESMGERHLGQRSSLVWRQPTKTAQKAAGPGVPTDDEHTGPQDCAAAESSTALLTTRWAQAC